MDTSPFIFVRELNMSYYEKIAKGMFNMAQIFEFPKKKEFPKELEERLDKVTKEYVNIMIETLEALYGKNPTDEEYTKFMDFILDHYIRSFNKAIDELE